MPLTIKSGGNEILIRTVTFDEESNSFNCYDSPNEGEIFSHSLPFKLDEFPSPDFTEKLYIFKNSLFTSKRLLKLKLNDKPGSNKLVGYIFQIEDLVSSPEIFENVHLKKIAYNVLLKLLQERDVSLRSNPTQYRQDSNYSLSDFYDSDSVIVVICDQFVSFPGYSFDKYLFDFFKHGFRLAPSYNFYPPSSTCTTVSNNYLQIQAALHLNGITNNLYSNFFIESLIKNVIFFSDNEVARFHLYYQVIEMLMEKVFKNEVNIKIMTNFNDLSSFDIKELFRETMKDSFALNHLLSNNYSGIVNEVLEELKGSIKIFFSYTQNPYETQELSQSVYKIRNVLFHGYSKILENNQLDKVQISIYLKKINDSLEYLIINLISTYKVRSIRLPVAATA